MSNALAIAGVTAVIQDLLNNGMIDHKVTDAMGRGVTVSATAPDNIELTGAGATPRLNLFLHQVTPNTAWRNMGLPFHDERGNRTSNPPLALDLHYLLTAYGTEDLQAEVLLGYLLQRMEAYSGLAILTTNMKTALDTAFQRRLRFIVQFPFPDTEQREAIWRSIFPQATPTNGLNFCKLAQLQVAGGNIRNIALNAAFLAADAGEPVNMEHLLHAAHGEGVKRERPLSDAEIRGWV